MGTTLAEVKAAQPRWFSPENLRFFGDKRYWVKEGKSGKPYLIRLTNGWTDMLGEPVSPFYCINEINPDTLEIGNLVGIKFPAYDIVHLKNMEAVNHWLKQH